MTYQYYTDPTSDTYDNLIKSGIKAGFTPKYARQDLHKNMAKLITERQEQLVQRIDQKEKRRAEMLERAEEVLKEDLQIEPDSVPVLRTIRNKTATFLAERLGKEVYATRSETVNVGRELFEGEKGEVLEVTLRKYLTTPQQPPIINGNDDVIDIETPKE
jgi:archaellum component FlaG (FlaF/FlaG flagellin family)